MKIIRVSTELELSVHDFPTGTCSEQNKCLRELIGEDCGHYEHVLPKRLYTELNMTNHPTKIPGQCVCMLVDEEGLVKEESVTNLVGSYLYESDKHGMPIVGNILFVGEEWAGYGIDFCGIEDETFKILLNELINMVHGMKLAKEALDK